MKVTELYDEETEELSEDLINISGELIDLTKTASNNFEGVSVFTDESQTEYKSIYNYIKEISEIYDDLSAKQQQNLLEKLFGKNRASVGAALISNFSAAEKAMDNMANSAGSAEKEMDIIEKSLTFKMNKMSQTATGIWQNLFKRNDIGVVIDGFTSFLDVIDKVTEKLGLFGTVGVAAAVGGIVALVKNLN